jgi:hypothetical protein
MYISHVNYRESYFQHFTLTKINGHPTYASLAKLDRECKANGKSVSTTLGGGLQGHLGLACSTAAYQRISPGVPFDRPILSVLPNLSNSTGAQIEDARQRFEDDLITFNACNVMEPTIVQQINTALDKDCLADLIEDDTGLLEGTIPEIIQTLFNTYGSIAPQSLAAAKAKVEAVTYNHGRPIVTIFTEINEYASMAEAAHAAETTEQLINIGIIIITRSTIFSSDIRKWHDKPIADKTWPYFKEHFKAAQKAIKKSQPAITTDTLGYHEQQANTAASLVDQVIDRLSSQRDDATVITAETLAEQQMQQQLLGMANFAQQSQQMLDQMTALATTVSTLQTQLDNKNQSRGRNNRGNRGRGRDNGHRGHGGRGGRGGARRPFQYCWLHGNCSHSGPDCESPSGGQIKDATYADMQGGSTTRCHWLPT